MTRSRCPMRLSALRIVAQRWRPRRCLAPARCRRADVGFFKKSPPRGQGGARQSCGFFKRQVGRDEAYTFRVKEHRFLQYSRTCSAKGKTSVARRSIHDWKYFLNDRAPTET